MSDRRRDRDDRPEDVAGDATEPRADRAREEGPKTPVTQQLGRIVVLVLLVLFIVFAVSNSQPVDFSWVVGATEMTEDPVTGDTSGGVPLIVLLLAAFAVGALFGAMVVRTRKRRHEGAASERE